MSTIGWNMHTNSALYVSRNGMIHVQCVLWMKWVSNQKCWVATMTRLKKATKGFTSRITNCWNKKGSNSKINMSRINLRCSSMVSYWEEILTGKTCSMKYAKDKTKSQNSVVLFWIKMTRLLGIRLVLIMKTLILMSSGT